MEEKENIITLIDEEGQQEDFEVIMTFELNDNKYVILTAADSDDDSNAYAFKIVYEGVGKDKYSLVFIEDDEEYKNVATAYNALIEEGM